jgi:glutathione S-transferase
MALTLYAHPFSSYCQKALIALYENGALQAPHAGGERCQAAASWHALIR